MEGRSRTEYSLLNIVAGVGGYIINTILGFICRMVFVKCLAADYLGVNGLFTNILSVLSLAELGIGGAIVYALYKPLAENNEKKIACNCCAAHGGVRVHNRAERHGYGAVAERAFGQRHGSNRHGGYKAEQQGQPI